jgi:prepilin-type N-terminal cleavage/methylation domain-containing protein
MRRRTRGFTLIEMLGAMTLLGAVWATVALALHSLQKAERGLTRGFESANAMDDLAQRLRSDAHAARSALLQDTEDGSALLLEASPSRRVRYRKLGQGVERAVLANEEVEHRETFYLPLEVVRWEIAERNPGRLVLLKLSLRNPGRTLDREHEIKAALGIVSLQPADAETEQP